MCDDGCCVTDLTSATEAVQLGNRDVTKTIDNMCEIIQPKFTRIFNISMLNVCSLPSKVDIPDCIELIKSLFHIDF